MKFRLALVAAVAFTLASPHVASAVFGDSSSPPPQTSAPAPAPATATPAPRSRRARPAATATPQPSGSPGETPPPPQFTTLDGVWEVELQSRDKTHYTHFVLQQSGQAGADVSGFWDLGGKPDKKIPITGTFDGRLFKLTATNAGTQFTFSGYVENYSDMVGLQNDGKLETAFTAEHRKKLKAIDQINPAGIPGLGVPNGPGGYGH